MASKICTDIRREAEVLELVKERDAIIRSNKDIKMKFTTSDTYLTDFARVCRPPRPSWHQR